MLATTFFGKTKAVCVYKNMKNNKIWQVVSKNGIVYNWYKVPSGSGSRAIICHLGSAETGLLENCELCFYEDYLLLIAFLFWL